MKITRTTGRRPRTLAGVAAASLLLAGLAACGNGDGGAGAEPATAAAGEDWEGDDDGTQLTLWTRPPLERQANLLVEAYNASHENQVELVITPDDDYVTGTAEGLVD